MFLKQNTEMVLRQNIGIMHALGLLFGFWHLGCGHDVFVDHDALRGQQCDPNAKGLRITELMANPAGQDHGHEWIEFYNASEYDYVLNRIYLQIEDFKGITDVELNAVGILPPGHYLVAGDGEHEYVDTQYQKLRLPNDEAIIRVKCQNTTLAHLHYGKQGHLKDPNFAPMPQAGRSLSRNMGSHSQQALWFSTFEPKYDAYNFGTPGRSNLACFVCRTQNVAESESSLATCWRAAEVPYASEVRLHSILADPIGPDAGHEWILLYNTSSHDVDLNGLIVQAFYREKMVRTWRLIASQCRQLKSHRSVVVLFSGLSAEFLSKYQPCDDEIVLHGATLPNKKFRIVLGIEFPSMCYAASVVFDDVVIPEARTGIAWHRHPRCLQTGCSDGFYRTDWPIASASQPIFP